MAQSSSRISVLLFALAASLLWAGAARAEVTPLNLDAETRAVTKACLKSMERSAPGLPELSALGYKKLGRKTYKKSPHKTPLLNWLPSINVETRTARRDRVTCTITIILLKRGQDERIFKVLNDTVDALGYKRTQEKDRKGRSQTVLTKGKTRATLSGFSSRSTGSNEIRADIYFTEKH